MAPDNSDLLFSPSERIKQLNDIDRVGPSQTISLINVENITRMLSNSCALLVKLSRFSRGGTSQMAR